MELYTVTDGPATDPVTLAEAKSFMKITYILDDAIITDLISAATLELENETGRVFVVRSYLAEYDVAESSKFERYPYFMVRRSPFKTLTSIEGSINDVFSEISGAQLKKESSYSKILITESLPGTLDDIPRPVQIKFDAGYGAAADVPKDIKLSIKQLVNFYYRSDRGDCNDSNCIGPKRIYKALYDKGYKIISTFGGVG